MFNRTLSQFNDAVLSIDYTDTYLAIGLKNSEILIYENNYIKKNEIINHQSNITNSYTCFTFAVLPNSNLVSGNDDGYISIWNSTTFKLIGSFNDYKKINVLTTLPNSNIVGAAGDIRIWNSTTHELLVIIPTKHKCSILSLAILPNTNIVSGACDRQICIWNSTSFESIKCFIANKGWIISLAILPDSNIVSGSVDKTISISQSEPPYNFIAKLTGHTDQVNALAILPNTNIVSGSSDWSIKIWQSKSPYECRATLYGHTAVIYTLVILPNNNNNNIVSGSYDKTIRIWNSVTFKLLNTLNAMSMVHSLAVVPINSNIVSFSKDSTIKLWQHKKLNYLTKLTGKQKVSINDLKFLSNGDLATCSSDNSILVWDMNTLTIKSNNLAHNRSCLSLSLLNNGNLVSSSQDKSIKIWNTDLFYNISTVKGYNND